MKKTHGVVLARARMPLCSFGLARSQRARGSWSCWALLGFVGFCSGFIGLYRVYRVYRVYRILSGFLNPNRPSRFDLHRHFFGIYRSSLPFTKQLIWVHMDQAAFGILSNSHPPMSSGIPSSAGFHGGSADCWVSLRFYGVVCRTRLRSRALLVENHNETGEISRATRDFVFHDNSQVAPQPTKRKMFVVLTKLFM